MGHGPPARAVDQGDRLDPQAVSAEAPLKAGGLTHIPSGVFYANAAWLALAVLAHNLGRWTLHAAGGRWADATVATLRTKLVAMPAASCGPLARSSCGSPATGHGATPTTPR